MANRSYLQTPNLYAGNLGKRTPGNRKRKERELREELRKEKERWYPGGSYPHPS